MKVSRKQLRKIILKEMFEYDPSSLALQIAGLGASLPYLYQVIFKDIPAHKNRQKMAEEIAQAVEAKQASDVYQPQTPRERYQQQHGISHRDYFSDLPDSEKAKYGGIPGDDE